MCEQQHQVDQNKLKFPKIQLSLRTKKKHITHDFLQVEDAFKLQVVNS